MKLPKLIKRASEILSDENRQSAKRKEKLKEIQRQLKKKTKKLKEKLESEQNEAIRKVIMQKISVASAHRKKVIKELKKLEAKD